MQLRDEDFDNVNPGEVRFLIPTEGSYPAQFIDYEAKTYGNWGEKLIVRWKVLTSTDMSKSVILCRYYNLKRDGGGRLLFGPLHDFRKDWIAANGGKLLSIRSKLPLSTFRECLFLVEVVTVRRESNGRSLPTSLHWSKIGRVIGPLANDLP